MQIVDLFSGVGGFSLAGSWIGWETVQFVEIDKFCQSKLIKHWPEVPIHSDIKTYGIEELKKTKWNPCIPTIITGGFPCQPFSVAGKQKGKTDDRFLWPQMLRVVREVQPAWIVGENVPGIIRMELENICLALESEGYEVQPFIIPSASIGSWDKRDRVWIIAYNNEFRCDNEQKKSIETLSNKIRVNEIKKQSRREQQCGISESNFIPADIKEQRIGKLSIQQRGQNKTGNINADGKIKVNSDIKSTISEQSGKAWPGRNGRTNSISDIISTGLQGDSRNDLSGRKKEQERQAGQANWLRDWIEVASELCGSNARVSHRMDRIKALGNSVNPYVPYQLFKMIEQYEFALSENIS